MRTKVLGFDSFHDILSIDPFFSGVLDNIGAGNHSEFHVQDGFLFKGNQLCVLDSRLRLKIIKEMHDEGHVGRDKTFASITGSYLWPAMRQDLYKYVKGVMFDKCPKG